MLWLNEIFGVKISNPSKQIVKVRIPIFTFICL
jgi:hypothetical protein